MLSYLLLNLIFMTIIVSILIALSHKKISIDIIYTMIILIILTAIFDSLIVYFGVVGYDTEKILGLYLWRAPIEDFAYAAVSVFIVGILWEHYDKKD